MHNFKYAFITLFKNKMLIFWTFAFPIILGTFFNLAFSNIENSEKLDIIDIAYVNNDIDSEYSNIFKYSFEQLSDKDNENRLFNTQYVTEEKAKELLDNNKIVGYLTLKDTPTVVVKENGINETILKYVVEEISQSEKIMQNIAQKRIEEYLATPPKEEVENLNSLYAQIHKDVLEMTQKNDANIKDISNSNLSYTMIEFYTLIAMTCLYGGMLGMVAINQNLANMSSNGKRIQVSPVSKSKMIFSSLSASYVIQLIGLALLFIYTVFVLKVDYGNNLPLIILLALTGSFAGLALGLAIGSLIKSNDNVKTGILISITMLGCFLSGMMGITMKYIIDKNIPILNKINPASMITDGFYSLYYYDTLDRYFFNIISLLIFAFLLIFISIKSLRRQKYDSI